jgi:hypothetical protein
MGDLHARFGHGNIRPVTDDDLITTSTTIIKCAGINLESRGVAVTGAESRRRSIRTNATNRIRCRLGHRFPGGILKTSKKKKFDTSPESFVI